MTPELELADIQGLIVRGYGALPHARFLLVHVRDVDVARATLTRWARRVCAASEKPTDSAVHVAVTSAGMEVLLSAPGPSGRAVEPVGFSLGFQLGMTDPHRSRLLGDIDGDGPEHWAWGGPATPAVHLLLLVYAVGHELLESTVAELVPGGPDTGLDVVGTLLTDPLQRNEAFGFHDGISQPRLAGLDGGRPGATPPAGPPRAAAPPTIPPAVEGPVSVGEFVLGYANEMGQDRDRPTLDAAADPGARLTRDSAGAADLGRNGTYLVLRQLTQDVEAFRAFTTDAARRSDGSVDEQRAEHLAAKMVGRWRSGAPLVLAPDADRPDLGDRNDFGYHDSDPLGLACPLGSHVRRVNPRDSLPPRPGTSASLAINRRHRLLRRGRGFTQPDGTQGLHFICLNADLSRQYEFVQHSWVNDPSFNGLHDSPDPVIGPPHRPAGSPGGATFTEQALPVRRRYRDLPQFVHVVGGSYFFLPGLRALRFLAEGPGDR